MRVPPRAAPRLPHTPVVQHLHRHQLGLRLHLVKGQRQQVGQHAHAVRAAAEEQRQVEDAVELEVVKRLRQQQWQQQQQGAGKTIVVCWMGTSMHDKTSGVVPAAGIQARRLTGQQHTAWLINHVGYLASMQVH